jgi:hypothetical protein
VERSHAWLNAFGNVRWCTERRRACVVSWLALACVIVIIRRLVRRAWTHYRWDGRSHPDHDHSPIAATSKPACDRAAGLAADVDGGAAPRVRLDLAEHLAGHRGGVALAEEQVAQQVGDGMALRPLKVAVGPQTTDGAQTQ